MVSASKTDIKILTGLSLVFKKTKKGEEGDKEIASVLITPLQDVLKKIIKCLAQALW